jgi:hypothetical protein
MLEERAEAAGGEKGVSMLVCGKNLGAGLALHRLDMDVVAVVVVDENQHCWCCQSRRIG